MHIMTNEEMVIQYQGGNKQALEQLLEANKGFIHKVSMKLYLGKDNAVDQEDLLQECRIGMIKAADRYKSDMANNFLTYAYYWMYQGMYRFMYPKRSMVNSRLKFVSLNVPISEDGETELSDTLGQEDEEFCSVEDSIYHQELNQEIRQAMNDTLSEKQRQVIFMRYGFNGTIYTLEQTGEHMGFTGARAREVERESLRKLRSSRWGRIRMAEYYAEYEKRIAREEAERDRAREEHKKYMAQMEMEMKILHEQGMNAYIEYLKDKKKQQLA